MTVLAPAWPRLGQAARLPLSFRTVNRPGQPGFDPGLQRHHLLPRQLWSRRCFSALLTQVGRERLGFDDFRRNGLLLPASEAAALRTGMPLHRGPHRTYNELVSDRVGQIEAGWARARWRSPEQALSDACERLVLLQRALRRRLLDQRRRLTLNRHDPWGQPYDYTELDAMAALLWPATAPASSN